MPNLVLAKQKIDEAADSVVAGNLILDRYEQYVAARDTKTKPKIPATDPAITKQLAAITKKMEEADKAAGKFDFEGAHGLLAQIADDCAAAAGVKKACDAYKQRRSVVEPLVTGLTTTSPRKNDPAIGPDVEKTDLNLAAATTAATKDPPDYVAALAELEKAAVGVESAKLKKKMKGNTVPTSAEIKKLMSQPGGTAALDEIIKGLDATTVNQGVFAEALQARFDTKFVQYESKAGGANSTNEAAKNAPNKSVKKFYELLLAVPGKHGKDNPKLAEIIHYKSDDGGADYGGGKVTMYCGQIDACSVDYNDQMKVGSELYNQFFPDGVEPDCQQANELPMPYFNFATLHEVGHAVDDKKGFMRKNGGGADFGGWEDYGGDVMPVARKGAEKFFGANPPEAIVMYLARKLTDQTPNNPPPFDTTFTSTKKTAADTWATAIRLNKNLWWDGAGSKANVIGGRVYQEYMDNVWCSYLLDARKQGIHGYQFRSPGEWFAEIYAAFFAGKLKPSHPAVKNGTGWLGQMQPPTV